MLGIHAYEFTQPMSVDDEPWFKVGDVVLCVDNDTLPIYGEYRGDMQLAPLAVLPNTKAVFLAAAPFLNNGYLRALDMPHPEMSEHVSYPIILRAVFGYADKESLGVVLERAQALVSALKFHMHDGSDVIVDDALDHLKSCEDAIVAAAACEARFGTLGSSEKQSLTVLAHTRVTNGPRLQDALRELGTDLDV